MNAKSLLLATLSLALFAGTSAHGQAITIVTSATQPTPGARDIFNFTNPFGAFNGNQDYSNNTPPGETFTTGGASSFLLNSVTVQGNNNAGTTGATTYQNATYTLTLYSVAGGVPTTLQTSTYTFPGAPAATDSYQASYLRFNLAAPLTLTANTQYAYTIAADGGFYGFAGSGAANGVVTTGGQAVQISTMFGGTLTTVPYSRNFDIGLTVVPEPGTWAMLSVAGVAGFLFFGKRQLRKPLA